MAAEVEEAGEAGDDYTGMDADAPDGAPANPAWAEQVGEEVVAADVVAAAAASSGGDDDEKTRVAAGTGLIASDAADADGSGETSV